MNQSPLRVLHVTRLPVTVTAFLLPILREHKRRGHDVHVACTDGPERESIVAEGVPVHTYPLTRSLAPRILFRAYRGLKKILRNERVDCVVTHTPIASAVARAAAHSARTARVIYVAHGLPCAPTVIYPVRRLWLFVERFLGRWTTALVTMNRYDFTQAAERRIIRNPDRIYRLHGIGIDPVAISAQVRSLDPAAVKRGLDIHPQQPMVLMLARTIRTKGVWDFLDAAEKLLAQGIRASFVLAGSGPLDQKIERFIARSGRADRLKFLGWRRDALRLMSACDVYVLPTYYPEGLPFSILEAMALSKPVVATQVRGCEDAIVDGETGRLVPPKKVDRLADAIASLLFNPEAAQSMGVAGRQHLDNGFRVDQVTTAFFETFDAVTSTHPAP